MCTIPSFETKGPAFYLNWTTGAHCIPLGVDGHTAVFHVKKSFFRVLGVLNPDAVLAACNTEAAICHTHTVIGRDALLLGHNDIASTGKYHIVLAHDAMAIGGTDSKLTASVKGQVTFGKYGSVYVVFIVLCIFACDRKLILCVFC